MTAYWQLLQLILPIFAIIGAGVILRRLEWLTASADESLLNLVVKFLYPCLIFDSVLGNSALRVPENVILPPLIAFATMTIGMIVALRVGRLIGLKEGSNLRTFAFATGVYNYGYIPVPLMAGLFGRESLGVLLVHNVGCEAAIWTVGILVLSGMSLREGWRRVINPPVCALLIAMAVNMLGLAPHFPTFVLSAVHLCAECAIPIGLMTIGATLENFVLERPGELFDLRITLPACLLRLGILPMLFLLVAWALPVTPELKRVLVVQAAMPTAILPVVIAKHYGGSVETAAKVVVVTNLLGLLIIPFWLHWGFQWVLP